ncbi:MAG: hypothetical protein N4A74_24510 [Carboxylicivirga sp.]|jgi:hypothetical protein|nr:hypothetical protein [Carboxylicivirga sp.]
MTTQTLQENLLEQAEALTKDQNRKIHMPVDVFLSEVRHLLAACEQDHDLLVTHGLVATLIPEAEVLFGLSEEAHLNWKKLSREQEPARIIWNERKNEIKETRDTLLTDYRYVFHKDKIIRQKLKARNFSNMYKNMIGDVEMLVYIGQHHPDQMNILDYKPGYLANVRSTIQEWRKILSNKNASQNGARKWKDQRERLLSLLKQRVEDIRWCGKFLWRNDPQKQAAYISLYNQQRNRRNCGK